MRINHNIYSEHKPNKRLGQNFLIDPFVIQQIVKTINPDKDDVIIEIGPGLGAITAQIIKGCAKLISIEIDTKLCSSLSCKFNQAIVNNKLYIINQNVLNLDFMGLFEVHKNFNLRIVGNLPYNISTPLLFKLFTYAAFVKDFNFLLQKEVAERLIAAPNSKEYGRLSIMAQYHASISKMFYVNAKSFSPIPKVESCFVKFIPYVQLTCQANNYQQFYNLVTAAFTQRRKKLSNALKNYCSANDLHNLGIDPNYRPEQLFVNDFVKISNFVSK